VVRQLILYIWCQLYDARICEWKNISRWMDDLIALKTKIVGVYVSLEVSHKKRMLSIRREPVYLNLLRFKG
jgi:chloramphenicol 3-O-phosphotransferase